MLKRIVAVLLLLLMCGVQPAWAHERSQKLTRGLANATLGWIEVFRIPKAWSECGSLGDAPFAAFALGCYLSVPLNPVLRMGAGVVEVVTSPWSSWPAKDYGCVYGTLGDYPWSARVDFDAHLKRCR